MPHTIARHDHDLILVNYVPIQSGYFFRLFDMEVLHASTGSKGCDDCCRTRSGGSIAASTRTARRERSGGPHQSGKAPNNRVSACIEACSIVAPLCVDVCDCGAASHQDSAAIAERSTLPATLARDWSTEIAEVDDMPPCRRETGPGLT